VVQQIEDLNNLSAKIWPTTRKIVSDIDTKFPQKCIVGKVNLRLLLQQNISILCGNFQIESNSLLNLNYYYERLEY